MNKFVKTIATVGALALCACGQSNAEKQKENCMNHDTCVIELNNGVKMPAFGLGTYQLSEESGEAYNAVLTALQNGYRHIDTAHAYRNEHSVGRAIKDSGIPRDQIWVTSKLWQNEYGKGNTAASIDRMLNRLGLEYVDLVYFHQPVGNYIEGWKELEEVVKSGKVRAIGISNFDASDEIFNSLVESATIKPQIMQIECHPYAQRKHWQEMLKKNNIAQESWFPLGGRDSKGEILRDPVLNEIGAAHGKTAAQVIIRWHIQEGFSVIPGTSNPEHIKENIDVFDFELSDEEMDKIRALNKEARYFNMSYEDQVKWFTQWNPED